jgi:hypothetical protein
LVNCFFQHRFQFVRIGSFEMNLHLRELPLLKQARGKFRRSAYSLACNVWAVHLYLWCLEKIGTVTYLSRILQLSDVDYNFVCVCVCVYICIYMYVYIYIYEKKIVFGCINCRVKIVSLLFSVDWFILIVTDIVWLKRQLFP